MSRDRPTAADAELAQRVRSQTVLEVSAAQIRRWASAGLIPYEPGRTGPGRGRSYPPEAAAIAGESADLIIRRRFSIDETALILFARGRVVSESGVRDAFRKLLITVSVTVQAMIDPLLGDSRPHSAGARWTRAFARSTRGRSWRQRLRGAVAEWIDGTRPVSRPSRHDRPRTLHPAKGLRESLIAVVMLLIGDQPSPDAHTLLLRAIGFESLAVEDLAAATPTVEELITVAEQAPLDSIRTAIEWTRSLEVTADLIVGSDVPDIRVQVDELQTESELNLALAALAVAAQWPGYDPPPEVRLQIAVATLTKAAGPDLAAHLRQGPGNRSEEPEEKRREIEEAIRQLADSCRGGLRVCQVTPPKSPPFSTAVTVRGHWHTELEVPHAIQP